mmetsp:Transcript_22388/g.26980  ORF Transcript_22388/g.26980 Transcript_22388/m.26980 type:complete len:828 (-) Transcript_22388:660-3143(-)
METLTLNSTSATTTRCSRVAPQSTLGPKKVVAHSVLNRSKKQGSVFTGCSNGAVRGRNQRLIVRAESADASTEADPLSIDDLDLEAVDVESVESIAATVEQLRLENEVLKKKLESSGRPIHNDFTNFEYPPITSDGRGIYKYDDMLHNHEGHLSYRWSQYCELRNAIEQNEGGIEKFSRGYEEYGFTKTADGIMYREWAPAAHEAYLIGDFNDWNMTSHKMDKNEFGTFELFLPNNADGTPAIPHGTRVKIHMKGEGDNWFDRIPAWIKMAVQAPGEIPFNGIYYDPPLEEQHVWQNSRPDTPKSLRIYEAHVGMSSPEEKVSTYKEFTENVLPRIASMGYNAVQLMAVQEHAFYGSFGYHVTNFFAVSSRSGTPDELKELIDTAHGLGLVVLMDIVHSHASGNIDDGVNMFDGSDSYLFHSGERGYHWMWDSKLFNYSSWETIRFLLSNVRWWVEEYKFDGFRFDGITSMMYTHHGLQMAFTGNYEEYFGMATDTDCMAYLMLVNDMLHTLYPGTITVAEDVSGMPTLCLPVEEGGVGFDYRLQMAIADKWEEVVSEWGADEDWDMGNLVFTMENRRAHEKCIGYAESHDQALVGSKTIAFWLMDADMYTHMSTVFDTTERVHRGMALHKLIRLFTLTLGGEGYLTFMGNEFGHPEWIDFPREDRYDSRTGELIPGNGGSYALARRRFDLAEMDHLRYKYLDQFEKAMNLMEAEYETVASGWQYVSRKDNGDNIIVYEKGDCVFVFNFHPTNSYSDYRIGCMKPGKYKVVLNSDREEFGGWGNVSEDSEFHTEEGHYDNRPHSFQVYTPSRTCVVYAHVPDAAQEA